jgi:glutathione reductase (NADPH)
LEGFAAVGAGLYPSATERRGNCMSGYDYDLLVIGAGSAGVRAARVAAGYGAHVAVAEEAEVGGTCVNRGCVPKKLFVHASHYAEAFEDAVGFGWTTERVSFDWPRLVENVARDVEWLSGVYVRNLVKSGAKLIRSRAEFLDPHTIRLINEDKTVTAGVVLIATGGWPWVDPAIAGVEHAITSNEVFHLTRLPKRLLVAGGGYIALEFAGVFNALGSDTTVLYRGEEVLRGFDGDLRKAVRSGMAQRGVEIFTGDTIVAIEKTGTGLAATTRGGKRLDADQILLATGRAPNARGLGLEAAGVAVDGEGAVVVDAYSRSNIETIYAVGDVTNRLRLTPVAIREGTAFADTVFGAKPTAVDYDDIPKAVFSQPEVGTVGLSEEEAKARFPALDIYRATFKPLPNRVAGRDERMLIKLVVDGDSDRVLGCHFVGPSASELAQLVAIAVKMGATKADFDATTALHPTLGEEIVTINRPAERYRREAAE